jgi:arylsulfatase A-like enzyme
LKSKAGKGILRNMDKQPNLLFIFADQLGAAFTGCYGHPQVQTPELDKLAEKSVLFQNAYTATPLCTPFRGTLFTGRYPEQTGVLGNELRIPPSEKTLASLFNDAGYNTSFAGKWHLSGKPRRTWVPPMERAGFSDFVGWDCGHVWHVNQRYFDGDSPTTYTMAGHDTDGLTDIACERLKSHSEKSDPFCMFVSYQAPHPICDPPQEYLDMYPQDKLELRPTVDPESHNQLTDFTMPRPIDYSVKDWTQRYFGEITHLDAAIGRLLSELEALNLMEDTVVVITADHGEMNGSHGLFAKSVPYEEASWIPLIIKLPGQSEGRKTDELFSSVDFLPTVLGLCGLPAHSPAEGVDYSPLLQSKSDAPVRKHLIMQLNDWACIREDDVKLTLDREGNEVRELYRIDDDPFEQKNLIGEDSERPTIQTLQSAYQEWLKDTRTRIGDVEEAARMSPALRDWTGD